MRIKLLDRYNLKIRFSIIVVFMVTITMILMAFIVYYSRKNGTFELTEQSISVQLSDLQDIVSVYENLADYQQLNGKINYIKDILDKKSYYENGFAFCIDNNGRIISNIPDKYSEYFDHNAISAILRSSEDKIIRSGDSGNAWYFSTSTNDNHHTLGIVVFEQDFWHPIRKHVYILIFIGISGGLIFFTILLHFIMQSLSNHLRNLAKNINKLALGVFPKHIKIDRNDEIGEIADSINELIDGLKKTSAFASEIGKGNYDYDYIPLSEDDVLGNALLETRANLKKAKAEQEERNIEEQQRNWITNGLAEFSDILRVDYNNINELGFNIIQKLIKYLEINQGGIFVVNDEDPKSIYLEMIACYAFDRQKFLTMKVMPGEGLVGACYLERKTTNIKKVPDTYISISSGLGEANPSNLLLVPLVLNEDIYGVIELASFSEFPAYKIEFIEKVAESIASSISNAKTNERTKELLKQSQSQAEQMVLQEKEMKQNMEEMQATQEEMQRLLELNNLRIEQAKAISDVRRICDNTEADVESVLDQIVKTINKGWQHSDNAVAKILFDGISAEGDGYLSSPWKLVETSNTKSGKAVSIEVAYNKEFPEADIGPFLNEEAELLKNIAALLKSYLNFKAI